MLTGTSIQQREVVQPLRRWSIHHHFDLRRWWGRVENEMESVKQPAKRKTKKKPAQRNQGFHLAWFNLWWGRMLIEAKNDRENLSHATRLGNYLKPTSEKLQSDSRMIPADMGPSNYDTCNVPKPDEAALQLTLSSKKRSSICTLQSPAKRAKSKKN